MISAIWQGFCHPGWLTLIILGCSWSLGGCRCCSVPRSCSWPWPRGRRSPCPLSTHPLSNRVSGHYRGSSRGKLGQLWIRWLRLLGLLLLPTGQPWTIQNKSIFSSEWGGLWKCVPPTAQLHVRRARLPRPQLLLEHAHQGGLRQVWVQQVKFLWDQPPVCLRLHRPVLWRAMLCQQVVSHSMGRVFKRL